MKYHAGHPGPVEPRSWSVGERVKFEGDRWWWSVRAVGEHFAVLTRQVRFRPVPTLCYTVVDWRSGVRGPCNLIGHGYGDGSYSDADCREMLGQFEAGELEVSQRNWVEIVLVGEQVEGAVGQLTG